MKKPTILASISIIFLILLISSMSASFWACFEKGDRINFCNPLIPDRTSPSNRYSICMSYYNETKKCYSTGNPNSCNQNKICSFFGENPSIDSYPPNITINNPKEGIWYNSRSILVDISLDEKAYLYYYDNIYGRRWTRICNGCFKYSSKKSFKEGHNNITFKAIDVVDHEASETINFFIDSRKPTIHKTEPRSGYASGTFDIQYTEDNLESIKINYGNDETGMRSKNLENCSSGQRQWCSVDVDLKDYNNEKIEYYFTIEDIVGNIKDSQIKQNINVDTIFPVFNNPGSYYTQGTGRNSRYIYFNFNVTEKNLYKIIYSYLDSRNKTRETTLCSRLKNGICETKKSFSRGSHSIDIQITDEAGNAIGQNIQFDVDY